jgi:cytochrome c biogenesis protein CcdA
MDLEQFAFPFGVGMLAAFNPCGFAMLPTWIGYFIGSDAPEDTRVRALTRGLRVGAIMTLGFITLFGSIGLLIAAFLSQGTVTEYVGYITVVLGIVLIPAGFAMFRGQQIDLRLPKMSKGGESREAGSIFLFGVSYAVVSLSCTIGLFVSAMSNSFTVVGENQLGERTESITLGSILDGAGSFVAYAVGMGVVILFLTVSLARAKSNVATNMRRLLPFMSKISGVVLVVAGIYLIDYGQWEIRILDNPAAGNVLVDRFLDFQGAVSTWVAVTTPERLAVVAAIGMALLFLLAWIEDNPNDSLRQLLMTASWTLVFVTIEFVNDGEFVIAPLLRFFSNWPNRIGNWFTDPLRGGVPFEFAFVTLAGWWAFRRISRYLARDAAVPTGTS